MSFKAKTYAQLILYTFSVDCIRFVFKFNVSLANLRFQLLNFFTFLKIRTNPYKSVQCGTGRDTAKNPQQDQKTRTVPRKSVRLVTPL